MSNNREVNPYDELTVFASKFDDLINQFPEKRKELCENVGQKLYEKVKDNIKGADFKESTGNLLNGVTKQIGSGGGYAAVKASNKIAPHTHLLENGHRIVRGKKSKAKVLGWAPGKHMYRNALNSLVTEIEDDAEKMLNDLVGDIFG